MSRLLDIAERAALDVLVALLWAFVIFVCCLSFGCATPQPWLVRRTGCEEIDSLPARVVRVERCTEAGFDHRACLLTYGEPGIQCVSQFERQRCEGPWDEHAHQCVIWTPYDEASWLVKVDTER